MTLNKYQADITIKCTDTIKALDEVDAKEALTDYIYEELDRTTLNSPEVEIKNITEVR